MIIHVVKQGETMSSIAELYGKSVERLIFENGITDTDNLAIGETLVILYPQIEYTIKEGDTLTSIARNHNTTIMELLRNNPYLSDRQYIYPDEIIVIKYDDEKIRKMTTNGYVYPFVKLDVLKKTLPFLTYLTVYSYYYTNQGEILNINDSAIIEITKSYGVAPIMMLSGYASSKTEEIQVVHSIIMNEEQQDVLIINLFNILKSKGYYGVNFKTPYIMPEDRHLYIDFIKKLSARLHSAGYVLFATISLSVFELLSNIRYKELDYGVFGSSVDKILFMSFESGITFGISVSVVPFNAISNIIEYFTERIPAERIVSGLTTIGYLFRLPYKEEEVRGNSMTYDSAIALARELGAEISYNEVTIASYFQYISQYEYIARFRDARGVEAILSLIPSNGLDGVAIWNCMYFFNQMWLIVNSQYEIEKVVPLSILDCRMDSYNYNKEKNVAEKYRAEGYKAERYKADKYREEKNNLDKE